MKKITLLLIFNLCMFTGVKSMEWTMDIESDAHKIAPPMQQNSNIKSSKEKIDFHKTPKENNKTNKLLKENSILLHTLIMQNKIHFEYHDDTRFTTDITINQHAKNTQLALDNLYKSTNAQLDDKSLHIPMTGQYQNINKKVQNEKAHDSFY